MAARPAPSPDVIAGVVLRAAGITKRFAGVVALDAVDFELRAGEIHALMGENGAGKSTLIRVMTGVHRADGGALWLEGAPVRPASPLEAERLGIRTVHQEVNLVPQRSVMENLSLGRLPARLGMIRWGEVRRRARAALARLGVQIDVARPLERYSTAIQQLVAIARAIGEPGRTGAAARVLILDEPTSSLDAGEVERLFAILRQLRGEGLGIIYISHFLEEIYRISDRVTVLRNGRLVGAWPTAQLPRLDLVAAMLGKQLVEARAEVAAGRDETVIRCRGETVSQGGAASPSPSHPLTISPSHSSRAPVISIEGLARRRVVGPISFAVPAGATLGLAGLLGSGRTETARLCFGADRADAGEMMLDGRPTRLPRSPRRAMRLGFAMTTEDRKTDGLFPSLSVAENIALALQSRIGVLRRLSRRRRQALAERFRADLGIRTPHLEQPIRLLSGGNQQKCLIARWLATAPRILILDEPTRGIDVGAKADVERLVRALCAGGASVLFISSELKEVVDVADAVVVLRDRRQVATLHGGEISEPAIMRLISAESAGGAAREREAGDA